MSRQDERHPVETREVPTPLETASLGGAQVSLALGASDIVGVWDGDLVAGVVYGDANFARIYGVDPEVARKGVPRGGYLQNIHPDDIVYVREAIDKLFAGAPDYMNEHRIIRPDGGLRWVLTRGRVVRDAAGVPTRFAGVSVDITDRKRAEDRLRRLNSSLETEIEARILERERNWKLAPVLMVVGGQDGVLREVNPAWSRVLGWSAEESVGHDIMEFVAAGTERLATETAIVDYQTFCLTKSGESRCISWTTVIEAGCFYGYGRDVTDQMVAEDRLRQAQKMEAVGQLTGGVAHDFNNLLAGIGGCLELLEARIAEGRLQEAQPLIAAARGAARRAAALTHRLLAFSRRQTLDPRPTDVNVLVSEMEELIRRTVGPSLEFSVTLESRACITWVDAHQLENALLNLCINARDAMPDGGRLAVLVGLAEAAARRDDMPRRDDTHGDDDIESGDFVTLEVADTGSGMTPEVLRRAFDPFFTTKPVGAGTGLGLSMVYGFARQSGGLVRIHSQPGAGTRVVLYLPRHAAELGEVVVPLRSPQPPRVRPSETVLVVDDEPTVRLLVMSVLQDLGYPALEAEDGASALEILRVHPQVALLVTDVGLPGRINGRQLADACRETLPRLRVLFVTGYTEDAVLAKGRLPAGMSVLNKPFAVDALEAKIAELMEAMR